MTVPDPRDQRIAELEEAVRERDRRISELEKTVDELRRVIEEWKRGHRSRGRVRRTRGAQPEGERKKPGRKPGHVGVTRPTPSVADREEHHPAAVTCEACAGAVSATGQTRQHMVEEIIPARREVVRHVQHEGECQTCGHRQWGRLPPELGPNPKLGTSVLAFVASLRFSFGLSWHKSARFLEEHCGLEVTPGGLCQMFQRNATRTAAVKQAIADRARSLPFVHMDETSWYEALRQLWAWVMTHPELSLFHIDDSRGKKVVDELLRPVRADGTPGEAYAGVVVSDFLGSYTTHDWIRHQYCWPHLLRAAHKEAELSPCWETRTFLGELRSIYHDGLRAQASGDKGRIHGIRIRLGRIAADPALAAHPEVDRLQWRIHEHFHGLLTFLSMPGLPADNNQAERDLRFLVMLRKMSFTTRSDEGTRTLAHWLSLVQTARKQKVSLHPFLVQALAAHHRGQAPPSLFRN